MATRLFSGLEESLLRRRWRPSGAPTIYKLIEALDHQATELCVVFTCKDGHTNWRETADKTFRVDGLDADVTVLASKTVFSACVDRLGGKLREVRHLWKIWRMQRDVHPDVVYFDRINIWSAAVIARFTSTPVVLRVMGIPPDLRDQFQGRGVRGFLFRWAYRSPFAFVICTQDGSGPERWLARVMNPKVPRKILLNGVDFSRPTETANTRFTNIPKDRTVVLILGRLDKLKACDEFLDGFLRALSHERNGLHALIVGSGNRASALHERAKARGAEDAVTFISTLPHDQVINALARSHIYVSLNRMGNLSNANLEAMQAGCCMIIPESQPDTGVDLYTDEVLPEDTAFRIPSSDDTGALANAILHLHRHPDERAARGAAIKAVAQKILPSWDERIATELAILRSVSSAGPAKCNAPTS